MANISSFLETIKKAIYGRDMRSALHDAIKDINDDVDDVKEETEALRTDLETYRSNDEEGIAKIKHEDLPAKEDKSNKIDDFSNIDWENPTTQYPTARVVYDSIMGLHNYMDTEATKIYNIDNQLQTVAAQATNIQFNELPQKEDKSNKITEFDYSSETDEQYPSAKLVADGIRSIGASQSDLEMRMGAFQENVWDSMATKEDKSNKLTEITSTEPTEEQYYSAKAVNGIKEEIDFRMDTIENNVLPAYQGKSDKLYDWIDYNEGDNEQYPNAKLLHDVKEETEALRTDLETYRSNDEEGIAKIKHEDLPAKEDKSNKITTFADMESEKINQQYPSAGAVYEILQEIVATMPKQITVKNNGLINTGIENLMVVTPNTFIRFGIIDEGFRVVLDLYDSDVYQEYMFEFTPGTSGLPISFPNDVKWVELPKTFLKKRYQCSIVNKLGVIVGVDV